MQASAFKQVLEKREPVPVGRGDTVAPLRVDGVLSKYVRANSEHRLREMRGFAIGRWVGLALQGRESRLLTVRVPSSHPTPISSTTPPPPQYVRTLPTGFNHLWRPSFSKHFRDRKPRIKIDITTSALTTAIGLHCRRFSLLHPPSFLIAARIPLGPSGSPETCTSSITKNSRRPDIPIPLHQIPQISW